MKPQLVPETPKKINVPSLKLPVAEESLVPDGQDAPAVWLMGAHGGAGTTTLAHCWAPFAEASMFPAADDPNFVVVVTAAHRSGLDSAHRVIRQMQAGQAGGCELLGLVLVHMAPGKLHKLLKQRLAGIAANISQVWEVPFVEQWNWVPTKQLPIWDPTIEEIEVGRRWRRKKIDPLQKIPPIITDVASEICQVAVERYTNTNF